MDQNISFFSLLLYQSNHGVKDIPDLLLRIVLQVEGMLGDWCREIEVGGGSRDDGCYFVILKLRDISGEVKSTEPYLA